MPVIEGWKCYVPGDLNPHLVGLSASDIMSNPHGAVMSYMVHGLSLLGNALSEKISPNVLRNAKKASIKAVVLGGYKLTGPAAASINMNLKPVSSTEPHTAQMLYVRVPEVHSYIPDPFCEEGAYTKEQIDALVEMHAEVSVPLWTAAAPQVFHGSIVEVEFGKSWKEGEVTKILSEEAARPTMSNLASAMAAFGTGTPYNKAFNETRPLDPVGITVHYTVTFTAKDALAVLAKRGYSYHYIVDKDGTVTEMVSPGTRAIHDPKTNATHVGLAFVNLGNDTVNAGQRGAPPLSDWIPAKGSKWEPYPDAQIEAGKKLVTQLIGNYPKITEIIAHSDSSATKSDAGPAFPMQSFKDLLPAIFT